MESSSESDTYERRRHRTRGRESQPRPRRDSAPDAAISDKINTLASTLQDTSRNLNKVDRMLGQYREHTDDQSEAMAVLRENLEDSIQQLQSQRMRRSSGARSASASTLHSSDLEGGSASDGQRFFTPTSPLRDYGGGPRSAGARRRSRSATVRFRDPGLAGEDVHAMHQSFRDLRTDQLRLGDDLDREILRRNRSDVDARRAVESLSGHLAASQKQESVSSRVEKRLQEVEREMRGERRSVERRPERRGGVSDELQEALRRREAQAKESDEAKNRLLRSESEKTQMELELDRARRQLDQSEGAKDALLQQVEDMRSQLLRTETERLDLQREVSQLSGPPRGRPDRQERTAGSDGSELEREVMELRAQLIRTSGLSEADDLRRTLERKERERILLCTQMEALSSDLERRERQQLAMLERLKEIQARSEAAASEGARAGLRAEEAESRLADGDRKREELKGRAQQAVRQWRAKCRRLQGELEETKAQAHARTDHAAQVSKEREGAQAQLKALTQQADGARREQAEVLARLTQREEELHRKDVELSETRGRHLALEQEVREAREAAAALEEEARRQAALHARLRQENQRLEEREEARDRRSQRDGEELEELREARAQLVSRLAEEEASRRELQRSGAELQVDARAAREESAVLGKQLEAERQERQRERAAGLRATQRDTGLQEALSLCGGERDQLEAELRESRQEREQLEAQLRETKAGAMADKDLVRALRVKLDRMKAECDKLTEELGGGEEANAVLRRKCQLLKQELDDKVRRASSSEEEVRREEEEVRRGLEDRLRHQETERDAVLSAAGEQIDSACRALAKDATDKLQALSDNHGLQKDPHCWLAETKSKLRWLCSEACERAQREARLRGQVRQAREQLKSLRQSGDAEQRSLLQRLDQQERLLHAVHAEKTELLEKSRRKEDEMRKLQDRVLDLEMSTRVALDHLESVPEKLCLMENFKDLEDSHVQKQLVDQHYAKYQEIVGNLQHQLDQSKREMQEYRDEKLDATSRGMRLAALSSSLRCSDTFLTSSLLSDASSPQKRRSSADLDSSSSILPPVNGHASLSDHLSA